MDTRTSGRDGSSHPHAALLSQLRTFVYEERDIATARLLESWRQPMQDKRKAGLAQRFRGLEHADDPGTAWATLAGGESRFREGDRLCLHTGSPFDDLLAREVLFELEEEARWLLRFRNPGEVPAQDDVRYFYAEQDGIDLTALFDQALDDIATSASSSALILPLLSGELPCHFNPHDDHYAYQLALEQGLNACQAEAVGRAFSAEQAACIQGPPGTGKTRVLALIARLMVARGEGVMITSHTHTAINNALDKVVASGVPTVKIGSPTQARTLGPQVARAEQFSQWKERPASGGYVVGATPFATCGRRLEHCEFDVIVFDEASQVTVPLALMAMRRGKRFVFIGDQQQLPPVALRPGGSMFLCADPRQGFLKSRMSWKSVGLDVAGRTKKLRRSYRTTSALLQAATCLLAREVEEDPEYELIPDFSAMEQGVRPILVTVDTPQDAVDRVVSEIAALAAHPNFPLSAILVMYGEQVSKSLLYRQLCLRVGEAKVWWLNKDRSMPPGGYGGEHIRMANIDTATGLEGTFVFMLGIENLLAPHGSPARDERSPEAEARKLYMAMTRSCYRLSVVTARPLADAAVSSIFERRA